MSAPSAVRARAAFSLYDFFKRLAGPWAADSKRMILRKASEGTVSMVMSWRDTVRRYAILGYELGDVKLTVGHGEPNLEKEDAHLIFKLSCSNWTLLEQIDLILRDAIVSATGKTIAPTKLLT